MAQGRVLVADDSKVFRALVVEALREKGWDVVEAANGRDAIEHALTNRPQLLILDALMPLVSGFDVILRLREKAPDYNPKVFLVTGVYKGRRWHTEGRQTYQVQEYLEKPIETDELLKFVARHFPQMA
ncbi:MAG: response regulator receiver protein [Acidobacteria bacterium]|jgi:DNA-binding response OmpR family regulator|nr:response regulator receiver protein [Acidobacteriota bacterium]